MMSVKFRYIYCIEFITLPTNSRRNLIITLTSSDGKGRVVSSILYSFIENSKMYCVERLCLNCYMILKDFNTEITE